jgi:hypothetical protein
MPLPDKPVRKQMINKRQQEEIHEGLKNEVQAETKVEMSISIKNSSRIRPESLTYPLQLEDEYIYVCQWLLVASQ